MEEAGLEEDEGATGFGTVVCGIDGSPQGEHAARQARELALPSARLWGVCVWNPALAMHAGLHAAEVSRDLRRQALDGLRGAQRAVAGLEPMLIRGGEVAGLLGAVANLRADLVSVGAHGSSRAAGVIFGSVATAMAHHAPCSVLVARDAGDGLLMGPILLAGDGSAEALDAARTAGSIAARSGAALVNLSVGEEPDRAAGIAAEAGELITEHGSESVVRVEQGSPHRRIVEVASEIGASLIIVGSRGRTGLKALGSVSERTAHRASCSVLIVRRPAHPAPDSDGV